MSTQWVVYDNNGVIAQGAEEDVRVEFAETTDFEGDLVLAEIKAVRR